MKTDHWSGLKKLGGSITTRSSRSLSKWDVVTKQPQANIVSRKQSRQFIHLTQHIFQSAIEKVFCLLFPTITGANKKWKPRGWRTRAEDSFMFSVDSIQRIKNSFPWRIRRNRSRYAFSFARPTSGDGDLRFELDTLLLLIVIPLWLLLIMMSFFEGSIFKITLIVATLIENFPGETFFSFIQLLLERA